MSRESERSISPDSSRAIRYDEAAAIMMMEAREGAYLSMKKLTKILEEGGLTESTEKRIKMAIRDIGRWGNDSLYHLCLPTRIRACLVCKGHIYTVSELEANVGRVGGFYGLGPQSLRILDQRLKDFNKNLHGEAS